jgi:hypothetical protein
MKEGNIMERISLKRWKLLAAMAAMVLVLAIPAVADTSTSQNVTTNGVTQDSEGEAESGEFDQTFEVSDSGGSSGSNNQCAGAQGAGNTAPQEGGTHLLQSNSEADEFGFEDVGGSSLNIIQADSEADKFEFDGVGGPLTVEGNNETSCGQGVNQGGSASD